MTEHTDENIEKEELAMETAAEVTEEAEVSLPEIPEAELPETPAESETSDEEFQLQAESSAEEEREESSTDESEEEFELELDYFEDEQQEEKLWQARTGLNHDSLCGAIETIIFMNDRPIPLAKIRKLIDEDMPLRVIHESILRLQEEYEQKHHGIRLQEVAEGYQFRTKATFGKYVQDVFKVNSLVLSPTALEVLAIIAYKQPCSKTEIDKIRGVDSSHIVRGLMDKRLVKVCGRSDEVGRPTQYGTTQEFLEVFNLSDVESLPAEHELEEIATANEVGAISDIKSICAGDKEKFKFDEIDELDSLSEEIKAISIETDFTKTLKQEERDKGSEERKTTRTAFDILEEFVQKKVLTDSNLTASESELFTAVTQPWVVEDLLAPDLNAPDDMDEDFEMIDLETGERIAQEEETPSVQELIDAQRSEADALSDALDRAFSELTGENLDEDLSKAQSVQSIETMEGNLEAVTDQIIEDARELDIDLEFLKEVPEFDLEDGEDLPSSDEER